jgi:Fe-S oxidoreductase
MMLIIRELLEGKLKPTEELAEHLYKCILCKGCDAVCAGRDVLPLGQLECATIFRALRADLAAMDLVPSPLKKAAGIIAERHNRQGSEKKRSAWSDGQNIAAKGEIAIFTSCTAANIDKSSVESLAVILKKADVSFCVIEDEWCCGALQVDAGLVKDFQASVEHNVEAIRRTGAKEVVTTCADCYHALKHDYPKYAGDFGFNVIHSSELILRLLEEKKLTLSKEVELGGAATYFDPCFLARGDVVAKEKGVTEEPRKVLTALPGTEWVEMEGYGRYTFCCGRPIMASAASEVYSKASEERLKDALTTGAKTLVTGCVNCKQSMKSAIRKQGADIAVFDIAEVVAEALA